MWGRGKWGKSNPYRISKQLDSGTGEYVLLLKKLSDPPIIDLGIFLGDAIHNLRSTLDHAVCSLIRSHDQVVTASEEVSPSCTNPRCGTSRRRED